MDLLRIFVRVCKYIADFFLAVFAITEHKLPAGQFQEAFLDALRSFAADILNLVPSDKPFKTKLFDALNLKEPHLAFEGALLRENPETHQIEVYLVQRAADDTAYPGEFHCPGSAVRNGETWEDVAKRLARGEYKTDIKSVTTLHEAGFFYQEARGWYQSIPNVVELDSEPAVGKWYPADPLPPDSPEFKVVEHHRDKIIPAAVNFFKNRELYEAGRYLITLALSLTPESVDQTELRKRLAAAFKYVRGNTLGPLYPVVGPLVINDSLEFGIIRRVGEELQGYMVLREVNNPRYSKEWHFPGLQQWPGEMDEDTALRGMTKKYPGLELNGEAVFIRRLTPSRENYAREPGALHINAHLWLVVGNNDHLPVDETHQWFSLDALPENTVHSHRTNFTPVFRDAFLRYEMSGTDAVRETQVLDLSQIRGK